jgi:uncharacterized protein (DUF433 family)
LIGLILKSVYNKDYDLLEWNTLRKIPNFGVYIMHERIAVDPNICHGQACVKGTRIPVHQIIGMLANGDTIDELLKEYPSLQREDILACLEYAASLAEEHVTPIRE